MPVFNVRTRTTWHEPQEPDFNVADRISQLVSEGKTNGVKESSQDPTTGEITAIRYWDTQASAQQWVDSLLPFVDTAEVLPD